MKPDSTNSPLLAARGIPIAVHQRITPAFKKMALTGRRSTALKDTRERIPLPSILGGLALAAVGFVVAGARRSA